MRRDLFLPRSIPLTIMGNEVANYPACHLFGLLYYAFQMPSFRHADRAPSGNYPNDPYDESAWPRGYSQLTARGHEQAKELGHYLAGRYGHFVGDYNRKKVLY